MEIQLGHVFGKDYIEDLEVAFDARLVRPVESREHRAVVNQVGQPDKCIMRPHIQ